MTHMELLKKHIFKLESYLGPAFLVALAMSFGATGAISATFGTVIPIGGHVSDIAYDNQRGLLYIANIGARRIDVLTSWDKSLQTPISVAPNPATLALSPDCRHLVIGHFAEIADPATEQPSLTILDLSGNVRQSVALDSSPLAIAFGNSPRALVVTKTDFQLLDPYTGTLETLELQNPGLATEELPVPFGTYPPEIIKASAGVSGDGNLIYVLAKGLEDAAVVTFSVPNQTLQVVGITSTPELGPRVVSVNLDGSRFLAGWALMDPTLVLHAQFPRATGELNVGSHAFDYSRDLIYAQVPMETEGVSEDQQAPEGASEGPVFEIYDTDNLTVRERISLQENLAGKSVFSNDMETLYAASDSGVTVLPIGSLSNASRVVAVQEDILIRSNPCDTRTITKKLDVVDLGGGNVDFNITGGTSGIRIYPSSGTTPMQVTVEVDLAVFWDLKGTTAIPLKIESNAAVNVPDSVRLLINTREPEQRGTIFNTPGKLVDILPDPVRDRFYVLRQDKNLMLVFDGTSFEQVAALRTGNTPIQMVMTRDFGYMIVTNDNSQIANVYDLDTLEPSTPILFPSGHYPRSIAVSSGSILAAVRSASGPHTIDRIDFDTRIANELLSLGIYINEVSEETILVASPIADVIFGAMPDGTVLLYDAVADTVVASRKDLEDLSGAYAAITSEQFVVDKNLFNRSLVLTNELEASTGLSSGFTFFGGLGLRTTSPSMSSPGVITRVDLTTLEYVAPTKMIESPLLVEGLATPPVGQIGQTILPFTRTLAPLANGISIVSLSTSGFMVLSSDFYVAMAKPVIKSVVNMADQTEAVAPGGLINVLGMDLSPVSEVAQELPLPTALGEACMMLNDRLVPLIRVSASEIGAQLPFGITGSAKMLVRSPGGTSDPFDLTILPAAPAVFRSGTAGPKTGLATVIRTKNNLLATLSNPLHPSDVIVVYLTGLGSTTPSVETGQSAPFNPLAFAALQPEVTLGGVALEVLYAGLTPGQVGVYQINARIPFWIPTGMTVPLTIKQGSQSTILDMRVVD